MKYTITAQGEGRRPLYMLTNLESARKAAQIVANSRNIYTFLFHPCDTPAWARRESFAPVQVRPWTSGAYHTESEMQRRAGCAGPSYAAMQTYYRECGRNCALAIAGLRLIYKRTGKRLLSDGKELRTDDGLHYVGRIRAFVIAGPAHVRVLRDYAGGSGTAGKLFSGAFVLEFQAGSYVYHYHTGEGQQAVSRIPAPEMEQTPETLMDVHLPALGTKAA